MPSEPPCPSLMHPDERFWRSIIEQAPVGFCLIDTESRIVEVNRTLTQLLGYSREELLGRTPFELADEDFQPPLRTQIGLSELPGQRHSQAGERRFEIPLRTKDGETVPVLVHATSLWSGTGELTGSYAFVIDLSEIKEWQHELELTRLAVERSFDGIFWVASNGQIADANETACQRLGYTREELQALSLSDIDTNLSPEDWPTHWQELKHNGHMTLESQHQAKDGTVFPIEKALNYQVLNGQERKFAITRDLTERKRQERQLQQAATVFVNLQEGLLITDAEGRIEEINPAFSRITGYPAEELIGHPVETLYADDTESPFLDMPWSAVRESENRSGECRIRTRAGTRHPVSCTVNVVRDEQGTVTHYVGVVYDIAELKAYEKRLAYQAYHDSLTDLPNRALFEDQLSHALVRLERSGGLAAVVFIDLDGFKHINDTLGHAAGDRVLKVVADRLRAECRAADTLARVGGDEFLLALEELATEEDMLAVAYRQQQTLAKPVELAEGVFRIGCSMGISLYPRDGESAEDLIRHADAALYSAKEAGRNAVRMYASELTERAEKRLVRAQQLRRALDRNELILHYQPQIIMTSDRPRGVEALVRWAHPEQGLLSPDEFVPLAEEVGLIWALGDRVLRMACRQGRQWLDKDRDFGRIAVNVAAQQVEENSLVATVRRCLAESGLPACRLELEFTESVLMTNLESASATLRALSDLGVRLSIDDFGTGYSSLLYLKRLPVERLKIGKGFVQDLPYSTEARGIVQAIQALANILGMEVIAEGVESHEQRRLLVAEGIRIGQGFLWAHPGPDPDWV